MKKIKSILLVDDDDDSNFISELLIHKSGITESIKCVKNGSEALQYVVGYSSAEFSASNSQIVLLDLHMPVMDGFDFLKELTRLIPNYVNLFKIFILTSSSNPSDIEKIKQYNIEGYITKPLDRDKINLLIG
jgi:CheY-like chemotaxis protein